MLLKKLAGEKYETEYKIDIHDNVAPAKAVDLKNAKIALMTTGGLVPAGNPDRLPSGTASVWQKYLIKDVDSFRKGEFYSVHGGFSTDNVNEEPEALMPLGTVRELLKEGAFKELADHVYTTTGNLTALKDARRMAEEIAEDFRKEGIDAAICVST